MPRNLKPLRTKPVYKGERLDRTSKEMLLCDICGSLATHRARRQSNGTVKDVHYCSTHLMVPVRNRELTMLSMLPKYRLHIAHMERWNQQVAERNQEALF